MRSAQLRPVGFNILLTSPAVTRLDDDARRSCRQQRLQRQENDCALLFRVVRFTQRMSKRPFQEDSARRANCQRQLAGKRDADSRNAGGFKTTCDQSHGPIAKPSGRRQKGKVDALFA